MRVLEAFETSKKLSDEGRACEIEFGGKVICTVQVRPADAALNADYRRVLAEMSIELLAGKSNGAATPAPELSPEDDVERLYRLYCRSVIVSWKWTDPSDRQTKALKFNEKNAVALFHKAPKFFEAIQKGARGWGNFRSAHEDDARGN